MCSDRQISTLCILDASMMSAPNGNIRLGCIAIGFVLAFMMGARLNLYRVDNTRLVVQNSSETSPRYRTFLEVGTKYGADKITAHHYEFMYEKYLRKYAGSSVRILEIGLGCGMQYGPGASAYLWRDYFGPLATIHFLEYDQTCGDKWYKEHGLKVPTLSFWLLF
jgi:hypothetical protein